MNPGMVVAVAVVVHVVAVAIAGMHSGQTVDTAAAASLAIDNPVAAAVNVWCRQRALSSVSTLLQIFPIASSIVVSSGAAGRPIHVVAINAVLSSVLTIWRVTKCNDIHFITVALLLLLLLLLLRLLLVWVGIGWVPWMAMKFMLRKALLLIVLHPRFTLSE